MSNQPGVYAPAISGDGARIAYMADDGAYYAASAGGPPERISTDYRLVWDLSADGAFALLRRPLGQKGGLILFDLVGRTPREILPGAELSVKFSTDMRWLAFHSVTQDRSSRRIYVLPFHPNESSLNTHRIAITDGAGFDREAQWSPDGNLLYWVTDRDGFRCIAARALNPATKAPSGEIFYVAHFHGARRSMLPFSTAAVAPAIAPGKLLFVLGERTANIWMTKLP